MVPELKNYLKATAYRGVLREERVENGDEGSRVREDYGEMYSAFKIQN